MRIALKCTSAITALLLLSACGATDAQYLNNGVGTDLSYSGLPDQTALLDVYVQHICRQAGDTTGACGVDWNTFVQAGMNDIDRRCDAYLAWLDNRKRSTGPLLQQIGDTQNATEAILLATGAGVTAIGVVGAAFGFARDTFNNYNSRLLTEVNHSTVQTVVLSGQTRFRADLRRVTIANQPQAIYALRQYLRICMPFTIENEINSTITAFERGGARALADNNRAPLIDTSTIGSVPLTPRMIVQRTVYKPTPVDTEYAAVLTTVRAEYSRPYIQGVLTKLCVPPAEIAHVTPETNARISAYQQWRQKREDPAQKITGKLSDPEITRVNSSPNCDSKRFGNYYEVQTFPEGINDKDIIQLLNQHLAPDRRLADSASVDDVRSRIAEVRKSLSNRLTLKDPRLAKQLTFDLIQEMQKGTDNGVQTQ